MNRRKLLWRIYPLYLAIILISLLLTALYASREMRNIYINEITRTLEARARLIAYKVREPILNSDYASLAGVSREFGELTETRITIIDTSGVVLGDSEEDPAIMENHGNRPEIKEAYKGESGIAQRYSNTLQMNFLYVASPVTESGKVIGVVRASLPISTVENKLRGFYYRVAIGGALITIIAGIISILIFRRLTIPITRLREAAERFARGQFQMKFPPAETEEISALSESMNSMAEQLDVRFKTIVEQRNERDAILSSMSEGIIALDSGGRIVTLNRAAADFFNLDINKASRKSIHETVRIADLHDLVEDTIKSKETTEAEITLPGQEDRYLLGHGTGLQNASGERMGILLVFNDITRIKRLEKIRRDFVANVSHELKTPITAISGSAETLLGGMPDNPEDIKRFLEIIMRQSDRLNFLVEDLLTIARLESETEKGEIELIRNNICDVLTSAVAACREKGMASNISIKCSSGGELIAKINPFDLEQAIINLIDNAIKYSKPGDVISVKAEIFDDEIVVSVEDYGCGIESKHLPRIFERFYRIDKARSREIGGTGLGLAIVKHVALAHGGRVSVDSVFGKGSTFRIHLPTIA